MYSDMYIYSESSKFCQMLSNVGQLLPYIVIMANVLHIVFIYWICNFTAKFPSKKY